MNTLQFAAAILLVMGVSTILVMAIARLHRSVEDVCAGVEELRISNRAIVGLLGEISASAQRIENHFAAKGRP